MLGADIGSRQLPDKNKNAFANISTFDIGTFDSDSTKLVEGFEVRISGASVVGLIFARRSLGCFNQRTNAIRRRAAS